MLLLLVFKDPSGASYHHPKHSLRGSSRTKSPHPGGGGCRKCCHSPKSEMDDDGKEVEGRCGLGSESHLTQAFESSE